MSATLIRPSGDFWTFDVTEYGFDEQILVTDHPTELGATISDNAQRMPRVITMSAVVTETPLSTTAPVVLTRRRADFLLFLEACEGELLTLVADQYGTFDSYMLTGYPHRLDAIRRSLLVVTLKRVTIAEAGLVSIPVSAPAQAAVAASFATAADIGEQATKTAGVTAAASDTSALFDMIYGE